MSIRGSKTIEKRIVKELCDPQNDPLKKLNYLSRDVVFAARARCGETVDRIRSVRTEQFKYIRNFHPQRPLLQPNEYKDTKPFMPLLSYTLRTCIRFRIGSAGTRCRGGIRHAVHDGIPQSRFPRDGQVVTKKAGR